MPAKPTRRRSVKSDAQAAPHCAADGHERAKDFLTEGEVKHLLDAAKAGRHGVRDHLLLFMMFRHGLRVSEAVALRRDELDLDRARLWVRRLKGGLSVEQPVAGDELRAVKRHLATRTDALPWLFVSERGQPLTRQSVNYLIGAAAGRAGLPGVHPHTLRHSCGFYLANNGHDLRLIQDYLGHRDPGTPSTTRAQQDDASRGCGGKSRKLETSDIDAECQKETGAVIDQNQTAERQPAPDEQAGILWWNLLFESAIGAYRVIQP